MRSIRTAEGRITEAHCVVAVVTSPVGDDRDRSPGAGHVVGVAEADGRDSGGPWRVLAGPEAERRRPVQGASRPEPGA
ncbi:hypothetical protein [Streptomyces puniciscabiei]|uniref:hypothetical protein n=1 Tax=Streptomyces puniciscabiei TaxID=164348 RepID=UPI0006EB74D6|nr:hypothetical protein [Streptomyces puniciscabiei]